MNEVRFTLLTDGSSDRVLLPLLKWLLKQYLPEYLIQGNWADLRLLPTPPKTLSGKIVRAVSLHPCHILFVHRDAEGFSYQERKQEITKSFAEVTKYLETHNQTLGIPYQICVIPIRMQEAWFLFHEPAIRVASGNPNGRVRLQLPAINSLENLPDPKADLYSLLKMASELRGRKLKSFHPAQQVHLIADQIEDFSPLRALQAFRLLEEDIRSLIESLNLLE